MINVSSFHLKMLFKACQPFTWDFYKKEKRFEEFWHVLVGEVFSNVYLPTFQHFLFDSFCLCSYFFWSSIHHWPKLEKDAFDQVFSSDWTVMNEGHMEVVTLRACVIILQKLSREKSSNHLMKTRILELQQGFVCFINSGPTTFSKTHK